MRPTTTAGTASQASPAAKVGAGWIFLSFLRLGLTCFGGPAMVAYIRDLAVKEKRQDQRLAGVVFDGCYIIFCRYLAGKLTDSGPFAVNEQSLGRMLGWLAEAAMGAPLLPMVFIPRNMPPV
jgi:hypothetical protein